MAASSQYHRGATAAHSRYHALPGSPEHLYTDLATSWNSSHGGLSRVPAPSALLQRLSSPAHRPPAHYLDYSGSSDQFSQQPHTQHTQPAWPAPQPWSAPFSNASFTARSLSYGDADGRLPVPHLNPPPARHYHQNTSETAPPNSLNQAFRSQGDYQDAHIAADSSLAAEAPTLAPVASILNYASPDLHLAPGHASSQAAVSWAPASNSNTSPPASQYPFRPTRNALPSDVGLGNAAWAMASSGPSNATSAVYERLPEPAPLWSHVEPEPHDLGHMQNVASEQVFHTATAPRARRSAPKKSASRVPAAFVARQQKSKVSKRRGPLDEAGRQKTHQMRKEKMTCLRCRFYKAGCDDGATCQKCLKTVGNARSFKLECTRGRLEDAMLVRHCNGRSNQEEGEFLGYEWLQNWQLRGMDVIWNLPGTGPIHVQPMRITIGQYRPMRPLLDSVTNVWSNTDGRVRVVEQPPYAVYDTQSLIPAFERYFTTLQPTIERWIFDRIHHDEIALLTYQEVIRLRSKQPPGQQNLLDLVMKIQCLSVVSQGYGTVWSNDVPGIQEYDYSKMGRSSYEAYDRNSRDRPLPGAISQQMDVAALKLLKKLEKACLKEFSTRIFMPKIKPWYELFLALYVIFWNMEYIHRSAEGYILSKNGTAIENHVSNVVNNQLKKWEYAFQILIQHWMAVLRDYIPFKLARKNPEEMRERGHLDPEGLEYVMKVSFIVDRIGGIGQSTSPYIGLNSTHNSLSSGWIKALFQAAGI